MAKIGINLSDIIAKKNYKGSLAWTAASFARLCVRMEAVEATAEEKIATMASIMKLPKATVMHRIRSWKKKGIEFKLGTFIGREPERLTARTEAAVRAIIAAERRKTAKA